MDPGAKEHRSRDVHAKYSCATRRDTIGKNKQGCGSGLVICCPGSYFYGYPGSGEHFLIENSKSLKKNSDNDTITNKV